ncbi:MAG: hypothetical protein E6Q97_24470 [Desulfurellales bacterium]|nr:MAG: hypothetical protein E6Q97_24470 [Desulfurellales bacterium]
MTAIVFEKPKSRKASGGVQSRRVTRQYGILNVATEPAATAALLASVPPILDGLVIDTPDVDEVYPGIWDATVTWITQTRKDEKDEQEKEEEVGSVEVSFDTTGGTIHRTQGIGDTRIYGPDAPDNHGAIGLTDDGVEGVDVPAPALSWTETHVFPKTAISWSYVKTLRALTGRTNDATFRGQAAGEVRYLGTTGQPQGSKYVLTFKFESSENATGLEIDAITGIEKKGWEYLWVRYQTVKDAVAKMLTKKPVGVYVQQVSEQGDFSLLRIGTGEVRL